MKNSPGVLEGNYVLGSLRQAAGRTGLRGIDWMWKKVSSGTPVVAFPIYDGHGNMVYTLSRAANETFSLGNKRVYGAWGDLRYDGNPNAGPNTQYCANLGHKKDGETDLIYMRARYYEPWTGRFISEDPKNHGFNWYVYANNNPITFVDLTGQAAIFASLVVLFLEVIIAAATDIAFQMIFHGVSFDEIDWASVGVSAGFGLLGGIYGHFVRRAFYFTKTPLHRRAWSEGRKGDFGGYFMKMIGIGTGTSLERYHFKSILRAMMCGGAGHIFMDMYSMYLYAHMEDE